VDGEMSFVIGIVGDTAVMVSPGDRQWVRRAGTKERRQGMSVPDIKELTLHLRDLVSLAGGPRRIRAVALAVPEAPRGKGAVTVAMEAGLWLGAWATPFGSAGIKTAWYSSDELGGITGEKRDTARAHALACYHRDGERRRHTGAEPSGAPLVTIGANGAGGPSGGKARPDAKRGDKSAPPLSNSSAGATAA